MYGLDDMPPGEFAIVGERRYDNGEVGPLPLFVVTEVVFGRIANYTRSTPTGPRPGRVYRKLSNWHQVETVGADPLWYVYVCDREPGSEDAVLHHPHEAVVVPGVVALGEYLDSLRLWTALTSVDERARSALVGYGVPADAADELVAHAIRRAADMGGSR